MLIKNISTSSLLTKNVFNTTISEVENKIPVTSGLVTELF